MTQRFELFLLGVVLRIARHWGCTIHFANPDKNDKVRWIKLVWPKDKIK